MEFSEIAEQSLQWLPEQGIGFFEVKGADYNADYFEHYKSLKGSPVDRKLNRCRVRLVKKFYEGEVFDFGIGSGSFIEAHGNATGYDINPVAVKWLHERFIYREPTTHTDAITFWDSFEHLRCPADVLRYAKKWVFISLPLFRGVDHILRSKHYKQTEHYWYFTLGGMAKYMADCGFELVEFNHMEIEAGREDIGTFVFQRIEA